MLSGPFDSAYKFVAHVALTNCTEYFSAVERHKESGNNTFAAHTQEIRLLWNAAVSLSHALEWQIKELGETGAGIDFKENAEATCPALAELRDFANAAKHRFRGKPKDGRYPRKPNKPNARETIDRSLLGSLELGDGSVEIKLEFVSDTSRAHELVSEAFRFWVEWLNAER